MPKYLSKDQTEDQGQIALLLKFAPLKLRTHGPRTAHEMPWVGRKTDSGYWFQSGRWSP